jgi:AsmA protein
MKKVLLGIAIVIALVLVIAIAAPFFIPAELYKDQLVAQVKSATGRDMRIEGPVRVSLLPRIALEAEKVALSNPAGAAEKDMAALGKLQVQLQILPLLSGEVAVDRFVLVAPVIHLEIDKKGKPNWRFETAGGAAPAQASSSATTKGAPGKSAVPPLQELRLGEVKIEDGRITYLDQRSSAHYEVSDVDVAVKLPSLDQPVNVDGALVWNGKRVQILAKADRARALLDHTSTPVSMKLASEPVSLNVTGTAALPALSGDVDLKVPSVRALAAWTGQALPATGEGLGPFSLGAKFTAESGRYAFANARVSLDEIKGTGEVQLDTTGVRPRIAAKLAVDGLDLNPYLGSESASTKPAPAAPGGAAPSPGAAASEWSDAPIDVTALRMADADLDLSATGIRYRKMTADKGLLGVKLQDGRLDADLRDLELYQGKGQGKIALADHKGAPSLELSFRLAGVDAEKLLQDVADFGKLRGTANINLDAAGAGKSQRAIVSDLDGKGAVSFTDGALKGVDLAKIARNVAGGGAQDATEFSELKGTFTIENGLVRNNDLVLVSPLLRVEGAGTVDLPKRTVDYRLSPKGDLDKFGVSIAVQGPWASPSYNADLGNVPGRLLERLERRDQAPSSGGEAPSGGKPKPADILRGLLGK